MSCSKMHCGYVTFVSVSFKNLSKDVSAFDIYMSRVMRKPTMWFPNRSDTNQTVQAQKMARGWKIAVTAKLIGAFVFAYAKF